MAHFYFFLVLYALWQVATAELNSDACIIAGNRQHGYIPCSSGEIQLNGTYVNLGIHNVGSFGTVNSFNSPYYQGGPGGGLGIISDYERNGFNSSSSPLEPTFGGDFTVSSASLEGKIF
ncbi:hypothetical protein EON65_21710 [archaeon]|nr:MAG: hypothetical protein EON65_21710 [archaeon]